MIRSAKNVADQAAKKAQPEAQSEDGGKNIEE